MILADKRNQEFGRNSSVRYLGLTGKSALGDIKLKNFTSRVFVGLGLLALIFLCNFYGANTWAAIILLASILGFKEFKTLCNNMGVYPLASWIYVFITVFMISPLLVPLFVTKEYTIQFVYPFMATLMIASYVIIFPRVLLKTTYTKFEDLTASFWAVFQFGLLPSFFIWIRIMDQGLIYTLLIILTISANDTGSLIFGKLFGKTPLAPQISPGKTVIGSVGGLISAAAAFYGFSNLFNIVLEPRFVNMMGLLNWNIDLDILRTTTLISAGLLFAIVAQIGDLMVSALKRAAGVKDSGTLLLSHGGVLDRVDSHLFAVWFAYFIFAYIVS